MPRSDPGSSAGAGSAVGRPGSVRTLRSRQQPGFTLIEVMVVMAVIAIAVGVATLALRDSRTTRLDREAARLSALLETARAEARVAQLPVRFELTPDGGESQFRFTGLPASRTMPTHWLDDAVRAEIADARPTLVLGPEALIGPQRIALRIDDQRIDVGTDGLRPFSVVDATSP
jgi:general secretion pathway protein H